MNIYWIEIKRLVENNVKRIVILTIIISSLFSILIYTQKNRKNSTSEEVNESSEVFNDDSSLGYFQFYIEYPDGDPFTNVGLLNQLFNSELMYENVLARTSINIDELKDDALDLGADDDFQPINVSIDSSSNVFTASFDTGSNRDNIKLANFYYEYLLGDNFNVLQNNNIYEMNAPQIFVQKNDEQENNEDIQSQGTPKVSITDILFIMSFGLLVGLSSSLIYIFIKELFSKTLNYSFAYSIENPNLFILIDSQLNKEKLLPYFVDQSDDSIILMEEQDKENSGTALNVKAKKYQSLLEVENEEINQNTEVVIILIALRTNRKWYNSQLRLCEIKGIIPKIVQINI